MDVKITRRYYLECDLYQSDLLSLWYALGTRGELKPLRDIVWQALPLECRNAVDNKRPNAPEYKDPL